MADLKRLRGSVSSVSSQTLGVYPLGGGVLSNGSKRQSPMMSGFKRATMLHILQHWRPLIKKREVQ